MKRFFLAMFGVALIFGAAACSKHDDSSSSATDAPMSATDAPSSAATDLAAPVTSPDASATAADASASAAGSSAAGSSTASTADVSQLARDGFPMYPNATLVTDQLLDATANSAHTVAAELTTTDDFDVVDAWYKSHLSSQYTPTHVKTGDVEESTYTLGSDTSLPHYSAIVARVKADSDNKASTKIVIAIKETAK